MYLLPVGTGTHCYLLFRYMNTESQGTAIQSGTAMSSKVYNSRIHVAFSKARCLHSDMSGKAIGNTYSARMQYFNVIHFCVFTNLFFPSVCCLSIIFLIKIKEIKSKSWPGG